MESSKDRTDGRGSAEQAERRQRQEETRQVYARIGDVPELPGFKEQTRRRKTLGERSAGSDRDDDATLHPEGAWFRRADSEAELSHPYRSVGQVNARPGAPPA